MELVHPFALGAAGRPHGAGRRRRGGAIVAAVLATALGVTALVPASARIPSDPTTLVARVVTETLVSLRALPDAGPAAGTPSVVVDRVIGPHIDFEAVAARILGPYWAEAGSGQREAFVARYRRYLAHAYSGLLTEFADVSIEYLPAELSPSGRFAKVRSKVAIEYLPLDVRVDYWLRATGSGWRLLDVKLQGVSLTETHARTLAGLARQGGMPAVLDVLDVRMAALAD